MNIKLDENLPHQLVQFLTDLGHDVDTVPDEHLAGRDDGVVWAAAQTAGRFLLCADARVALELDGAQHLSDPVAYRRDRRKDRLLQENGYFVLRFLAEDVGKELDVVLDAILQALSRRRGSSSLALAIARSSS